MSKKTKAPKPEDYAITAEQVAVLQEAQVERQAAEVKLSTILRTILAGHGVTQIQGRLEIDDEAGVLRISPPTDD